MSNTQLQQQIADEPQHIQDAILAINTDARNRSSRSRSSSRPSPHYSAWPTRSGCGGCRTSNPQPP